MLALSSLGGAKEAAADEFHSTRTSSLTERRHVGVLTLSAERAELVVQRTVYNPSSVSDQATFMIDLPEGAVATRLRTRGIGPGAPWFEGELLEAEEAAKRYRELTGLGGYYPKDPALLSWRDQRLLALQVFPCPPRSEKLVEYTLTLPLSYEQGRHHLKLSALGTSALRAKIQLVAKNARDTLSVDGKPVSSGAYLPTAGNEELDVALETQAASLDAELSSQGFAGGRVLTHYAVRAATKVSTLPKQAYVVLVLDASRSTFEGFEESAKAALDAYLSHLPDAHVEVLTFDRNVRHQLNGFGNTSAALRALQVLALGRLNGSAVDRALFEADQMLAAAPRNAPRRIVLMTDGLTRQSLTPERLRGAIGQSGAVLHVGLVRAGDPQLARFDNHAWEPVARSTGGVVWQARAPDDAKDAARLRDDLYEVYEEWARPKRIDHLSCFSQDGAIADNLPDTLAEGEGSQDLYLASTLARSLSVAGELWSTPIQVMARQEPAQDARWAALVFGSALVDSLSEPEMMTLALRGRAVSPVTSYLAIEPGVRPSTEGLTELEGSGIGLGGISVGHYGGGDGAYGHGPQLDRQAFLESELRPELARCGGKAGTAYVDLETTRDEIVEVKLSSTQAPLDDAVASCVDEAVWALLLPAAFDEEFAQFRVEL